MAINFKGHVFQDDGDAVNGATVQLLEAGTTTEKDSTTTNSAGLWSFSESDVDKYDVKIASGTSVRYIRWDDWVSFQELDVRNNAAATTPAATFTNFYNSASNQVAVFSGANSTRADNDEVYMSFKLADSAGNLDEFARMTVVATDVTSGSEDGQIEFDVIKGGQPTKVWTITSSTGAAMSFDMNVDALTIGSGADTDVSLTFDANTYDGVITWMEDEDHFKFSDDILMNGTEKILFGDTGTFIHQSSDGVLTITSDTTVDINGAVVFDGALSGITNITLSGTLSDSNYTFDTSGNVSGLGTVASGAITSSGIIKTDNATDATSTTDGSLQTDGGLSVVKDAVFGDDIKLLSDSAVIALGADGDTTLTHTDGTGLTLNSTNKLTFGDAASFIQQSADGTLRVDGEAIIDLNASTRVDVSAALTVGTDANIGNDLSLTSDSAVFNMGDGNDFTITHDGTTGATLAGNPITITAAGASTWSTSSGALTLTSAAAATWSTAAGALTIDGDDGITLQTTGSGNVTVSEILDITDATDSSDATGDTGALRTEGGASIAKKLYVGTDASVLGAFYVGAGGNEFSITESSDDITIKSLISDKDLKISGNDGGSNVDALSFDMSAAGAATFASGVTLTSGNVVVASGNGIDFSATGDPTGTGTSGSSTQELLDDYEEGTFSPIIVPSTGATGSYQSTPVGKYTKIGRLVNVSIVLENASDSVTAGATIGLGGLPFTPASGNWAASVGYGDSLAITAGHALGAFVLDATARIRLVVWDSTTGMTQMTYGELSNRGYLIVSASYNV